MALSCFYTFPSPTSFTSSTTVLQTERFRAKGHPQDNLALKPPLFKRQNESQTPGSANRPGKTVGPEITGRLQLPLTWEEARSGRVRDCVSSVNR